MSITSAFLYRYAAVVHSTGVMHKRMSMTVIILMHVFYSSPVAVLSLYATLQDNGELEADMKEVSLGDCAFKLFFGF